MRNTKVAAFDTRFEGKNKSVFLRLVMRIFSFAAPKITKDLKIKGVGLAIEPEGFIMEGKEGPLKAGELERATEWARGLLLK